MRKVLTRGGAVVALVGAGLVLAGVASAPREGMYAWHFALMFGTTTAVGALFLLMFGHAANAGWFVAVRRPVEHLVGSLPLLAVLFIPTLVFTSHLFPWSEGWIGTGDHALVAQKRAYLNRTDFAWRTIGTLMALIGVGEILRYYSRRQDSAREETAARRYGDAMRALSAAGFPVLGLLVTISFVDWIMSLQPAWYSTMFGVGILSGGFVAAVGTLAVTVVVASRYGWLEAVQEGHRHATGRVLFAALCFWGYVNFVQYLIIWIADLPEGVRFFLRRRELGWQWVGLAVVMGHLVVPFFPLLSRRLKESPSSLAFFGVWIVLFHLVAVFYLVIPPHRAELRLHWADPIAVVMVIGAMLASAVFRSRAVAPEPVGDPRLEHARRYTAP